MTPRPGPPPDLAGRWLAKFFTDHLAGERGASPRTVAAYRDAVKLLKLLKLLLVDVGDRRT